jgi:hypothetical protein
VLRHDLCGDAIVGKRFASETVQDCQWIGRRVSPPHAGVHLSSPRLKQVVLCVSPARGGSPLAEGARQELATCLPRTRGFTGLGGAVEEPHFVSPPHAGVHRSRLQRRRSATSVSPARGGSPLTNDAPCTGTVCLPRTRGFTARCRAQDRHGSVSPPHAGVHRVFVRWRQPWRCVSPARGGSPQV